MAADKNKDKKKRDASTNPEHETEATEPVVRDKRRIDPETGEARTSSDSKDETVDATLDSADTVNAEETKDEAPSEEDSSISDEDLEKLLEDAEASAGNSTEHLDDLKRVQAEYANYRKRVERDRSLARELAVAEVMTSILPVLDDLDLAQAHGDLEGGPLELVAQKIRSSFERYGLEQVGAVGETFDPKLHEAIAQLPSKEAEGETVADVVLPGYQLGERLLRAAKVAVTVPED